MVYKTEELQKGNVNMQALLELSRNTEEKQMAKELLKKK